MAKKVEKKIQRIETAQISERFKNEKTSSIEDLKMKLTGVKTEDVLSNLKDRLSINDDDPFAELKKSLLNATTDVVIESKEDVINDILDDYEEEIIEHIIEVETKEEIDEIFVEELIDEEEIIENPEAYYYNYKDSYNNNILVREVEKRKGEKIIVHIALNNLEHDSFKNKTASPFEIYHKGVKILDFYQFKKETSTSYNFKKDIYILRNNLVIDSKTYLLEEIEIVNFSL